MKIFDCITYFNEPMLFELRLNILDKFVDRFVVSEATFTHSGERKKINFKLENFPKFKNKITHIVVEKEPEDLIEIKGLEKINNSLLRLNAQKRIEKQREGLANFLKDKDANDWIIYSDSDEIPDLTKVDMLNEKSKIILFKQKIFHYKFNLVSESHNWFGSKACRLKDLRTITDLRNIKTKKYPLWRADVFFKKNKYINVKIIDEGGWHFTELKTPREIFLKHKNDENHDEFDLTGITQADIEDMVKNAYITYDHNIDKANFKKKWNRQNRIYLTKINDNKLPNYLINNKNKYLNWFA